MTRLALACPAAFVLLLSAALARAEAPAPGATCEPECRVGYQCVAGTCVSKCNPPCGPGTYCTEQRMCALVPAAVTPVPAPTASDSEDPPGSNPAAERLRRQAEARMARRARAAAESGERIRAHEAAVAAKAAARAERMAWREVPRITAGASFMYAAIAQRKDVDAYERTVGTMAAVLDGGWRYNTSEVLGVHVNGSVLLGKSAISDRDGTRRDETFSYGFGVGGGAFITTPFRLYFGPVASLDLRFHGKDQLEMFGRLYDLDPKGPLHASVGGEAGFLLGDREELDLSLRISAGIPEALPQIFLSVRYHIFTGSQLN